MPRIILVILLSVVTLLQTALAQGVCDAALVKSTYSSFSSDHLDWRLASLVTDKEYEEIKHDAGGNAVIYGVPVGASYDDFSKRVKDKQSSYNESLTHSQALNILWTGLDPNAPSSYLECLRAQIFAGRGLHLAVKSATKTDISLLISWNPQGNDPSTISPKWLWQSHDGSHLPTRVQQGLTTLIIPRPEEQRTFAVNYPGFTDSVVLEPLSKLPSLPLPAPLVNTTETYNSDEAASGACKDYGAWTSVCSPDKPEGWTIVLQTFQLTGDRAGCAHAECGLVSPATATKVCYHFRTQGHKEECKHRGNTGIHYSRGVLTVVWAHH